MKKHDHSVEAYLSNARGPVVHKGIRTFNINLMESSEESWTKSPGRKNTELKLKREGSHNLINLKLGGDSIKSLKKVEPISSVKSLLSGIKSQAVISTKKNSVQPPIMKKLKFK